MIEIPPALPSDEMTLFAIALGVIFGVLGALALRRRSAALLLVFLSVSVPTMTAIALTFPNTFVNGTIADAEEMNANFQSVESLIGTAPMMISVTPAFEPAFLGFSMAQCGFSVSDFEGDFVTVNVEMYANDQLRSDVVHGPFEGSGGLTPQEAGGQLVDPGEAVRCEARAHDGKNVGPTLVSATIVAP
ncbi:MAG: hypothetical protein AAF384_17015 [Pseudomonadota bacterium]